MKFSMTWHEKGDILIEVTSFTGLTLYALSSLVVYNGFRNYFIYCVEQNICFIMQWTLVLWQLMHKVYKKDKVINVKTIHCWIKWYKQKNTNEDCEVNKQTVIETIIFGKVKYMHRLSCSNKGKLNMLVNIFKLFHILYWEEYHTTIILRHRKGSSWSCSYDS